MDDLDRMRLRPRNAGAEMKLTIDPQAFGEFTYLGLNEKGLAVAAVIDDPKWKKDTAKTVSEFIEQGYSIIRLPHKEACARLKADWETVKAQRAKAAEAAS